MAHFQLQIMIVLAFLCFAQFGVAQTEANPIIDPKHSVVKITTTGIDRFNNISRVETGTGFIFHKSGFILTAGHVVGDINEWADDQYGKTTREITVTRTISGRDDTQVQDAALLYYDKNVDLALLRISCEAPCPPLTLGNSLKTTERENVQGIGWGARNKAETFDSTKVTNSCDYKYSCLFKFNQPAIWNGDSGGPILNEKLQVVGLIKGGADIKGDVLAIPINLSAPLRQFADDQQSEIRERFANVEQSLQGLHKIAEELRQNFRPVVRWSKFYIAAEKRYTLYINLYLSPDFEGQYLPKDIKITAYPSWKVIQKDGNVKQMNEDDSMNNGITFNADSDEEAITESVRTRTAILKPFEAPFKQTLKGIFKFSDKELQSLSILGANVILEWSLPSSANRKQRTQNLGAAQ